MEALEIHRLVMAIALAAVRLGAAFMLCPPLAESMIGGTARRCAILGFSLLAVPLVLRQMPPGEPALLVLLFSAKTAKVKRAEQFLRDAKERRQREDLVRAREIQYSSLPMVFPPYPRDLRNDLHAMMVPARDVGGDFYDFHYIGSDQLAFLVADVSGKGIPAAMMMMRAKALLRAQTLSTSDLGEAVREVNAQLFDGNLTSMFVTCWIGVLNEQTGELRYVNAGHNLPYLLRTDGSVSCLKGTSGMALGAWDDVSYSVFETKLEPGDALVLYTDGDIEAKRRSLAAPPQRRAEVPAKIVFRCNSN